MCTLNFSKMKKFISKHNIKIVPYNIFIQFETKKINYRELFNQLNITNFNLVSIDKFIKDNKQLEVEYNNNIIFQYCYLLLSKYNFSNKEELIKVFDKIHDLLLNNQYKQIDKLLKQLTKIKNDIDDVDFIVKKVNRFINSSEYVNYIKKILNCENNLGNMEYSNIYVTQNVLANTLIMLFVHEGNIDLYDFFERINTMSIKQYSIDLLVQKYKGSKMDFLDHMINYYNSRFFYHGTNSKWLNECRKFGLNGVRFCDYQDEIIKVIKLFESYGVYNVFEGRNKEISGFKYFITDSIESAIYYAHQSPEYFSRFCANGYCMRLLDNCDHEAFWRRDYKACFDNVEKLCRSINMQKQDTLTVINLFNILWKREVKDNQYPTIFVGRNTAIMKYNNTLNEVKDHIDDYSFEKIYDIFTTPSDVHNKRFAVISKDSLSILHLPNLYNLYLLKTFDFPDAKYIIHDEIKYYPDIIIKNEYYKNIYFILKDIDEVKKVSDAIYFIPNKCEKINSYINDDFYIQNLQYLILTNGKDITEKGRIFINNINISFDGVYKYYQKLTNKLINEYSKIQQKEEKIKFYNIIANNIFHNFYIMQKTNKFPILVDCGYKSKLHYDYDTGNYWYKNLVENNVSIIVLNEIIGNINHIFTKLQSII